RVASRSSCTPGLACVNGIHEATQTTGIGLSWLEGAPGLRQPGSALAPLSSEHPLRERAIAGCDLTVDGILRAERRQREKIYRPRRREPWAWIARAGERLGDRARREQPRQKARLLRRRAGDETTRIGRQHWWGALRHPQLAAHPVPHHLVGRERVLADPV